MHAGELAVVGLGHVQVERLALVDVGAPLGGHLQDHLLRHLPCRLVQGLQVVRDALNGLWANGTKMLIMVINLSVSMIGLLYYLGTAALLL